MFHRIDLVEDGSPSLVLVLHQWSNFCNFLVEKRRSDTDDRLYGVRKDTQGGFLRTDCAVYEPPVSITRCILCLSVLSYYLASI